MKRSIFFFFTGTLMWQLVSSQTNTLSKADYPQITTPSPEAAALGKYGDLPVSLFSGTQNIQIPIWNYANGDVSVGIGLSYHASGIKVDEIATNVGLGWALNAGGVITSAILGVPDGANDAFYSDTFDPFMIQTQSLEWFPATSDYQIAMDAVLTNKDLERDIYFFNFLGFSGKFVLDRNKSPRLIPANPNLKIQFYDTAHLTDGFIITDDNGIRYYFNGAGEGTTDVSFSCSVGTQSVRELDQGAGTWYLTKIETPDKRNILFEYETYYYTVRKGYAEAEYHRQQIIDGCGDMSSLNRKCFRIETIAGQRIKKIYGTNNPSKIEFVYSSSSRQDITYNGSNAGKTLDEVNIYYDATLIKKWNFTYDYFGTGTAKRLKLLTAKEDSKPAYVFTYDETHSLPDILSLSQDHWGYYNGATNTSFIPPMPLLRKPTGANRDGNIVYMKTASLTKIQYPTGGITQFEYEGHTNKVTEDSTYYVNEIATLSIGGYQGSSTTYFHLPGYASDVVVSWYVVPHSYEDNVKAFISDSATGTHYKIYENSTGTEELTGFLPENHTLKLESFRGNVADSVFITIYWKKPITSTVTHNKIIYGGLRIKSTKDYDSLAGKFGRSKYYYYNYEGYPDSSTIVVPESPNLIYNSIYETLNTVTNSPMVGCGYNVLSSSSVPIIGNGLDNAIGYKQVTVKDSALGQCNGRTIYKFSASPSDVGAAVGSGNTDWCKGFLTEQIDQKYEEVGQGFKNVRRLKNYYQAVYNDTCYLNSTYCKPTQTIIPNIRLSMIRPQREFGPGATYPGPGLYPALFEVHKYFTISAVVHLKQKDETIVDTANGTSITVSIVNYYDNDTAHIYPTRTETTDSRGKLIRRQLKYAFDKASSSSPNIYNMMVNRNIVSPVLEETATNVTNGFEIAKKQTSYQSWNGADSLIKPYQILTSMIGSTPELNLNILGYDSLSNLKGYTSRDGLSKVYLWDYHAQFPIAEIVNADTTQVAYTSFEADGKGHWTFTGSTSAHPTSSTGLKGYSLAGGNITRSGLSSGTTYVITYWKRDSSSTVTVNSGSGTLLATKNGWKLYKHEITGITSLTIAGTAYIDELRLHPKNALMKTYTYIPLVGMSSESDANNKILYYEYDNFNRLKLIRDDDGNILKRMDYKYQATYQQ